MSRNFNHNLASFFRSLFKPSQSKNLPLGSRVASTKMTDARLKALETPEHLKQMHAQVAATSESVESGEFQLYTTEEEVAKRVRSAADMSQYRLKALAKELPPDQELEPKE